MNEKKEAKTRKIIEMLRKDGHYVEEFTHGQIRVAGVDFWCTSEVYYHAKERVKGKGFKNFNEYINSLTDVA